MDTSAFVKLILGERESAPLQRALTPRGEQVCSALLTVESRRAAIRYGATAEAQTRTALQAITLVPIDAEVLERAAALAPPSLRSLDAIHLATALSLGADLEHLYCYDERLTAAAVAHGLDVRAPT